MSKLIIVSAPSGAGKTTLVKYLLEQFSNLSFSISCTTREKRTGEIHGKDYYFLTKEDFNLKIQNDEFVEYEEVYHGVFYGTLKSELERVWNNSKIIIFDVDVEGGITLKNKYPENSLAIFISPPSLEILKQRLQNRNSESEETLKKRIEKASYELTFSSKFDKIIINDDLEISYQTIKKMTEDFLIG